MRPQEPRGCGGGAGEAALAVSGIAEAPTPEECERHVGAIVGVLCTQGHAVAFNGRG